jgi:hypothetical protein
MSLGNVEQNPPAHTQHNEGGGGSNEGNINAAIKQLGMHCNQGGISNRSKPPKTGNSTFFSKISAIPTFSQINSFPILSCLVAFLSIITLMLSQYHWPCLMTPYFVVGR